MIKTFILVTVVSTKILGVELENQNFSAAFLTEATCWRYARSTNDTVLATLRKQYKDKIFRLECRPIDFILTNP